MKSRLKQLEDLKTFSNECEKTINEVICELNWDQNHIKQCQPMALCPFDGNHRMSYQSIDKHLKTCQSKTKGLRNKDMEDIEDIESHESHAFFYESFPHIRPVVIDKQIYGKILAIEEILENVFKPMIGFNDCQPIDEDLGIDRSSIELSSEQRLALYEHVIHHNIGNNSTGRKGSKLEDMALSVDLFSEPKQRADQMPEPEEVKTKLEMISMNRDIKRRRQSYRSKGVHTKGKSYSETLGEVIESHCKTLEQRWKSKAKPNRSESKGHKQKQITHKTKNDNKSDRKHNQRRHHSRERHQRHRHHKH